MVMKMKNREIFSLPYVKAAVFFTNMGQYLFADKHGDKEITIKWLSQPDVARAFSGYSLDSGWIKPGVIRTGISARGMWVVFSKPACRQKVTIDLKGEKRTVTIPIPDTLMIGYGPMYYLVALGSKFTERSVVFKAPFPNIYPDNHICWGKDNRVPKASQETIDEVWRSFFSTPFNADLSNGKAKSHKEDLLDFLYSLDGKSVFPVKNLVKEDSSLDQVIERIIHEH
jgi:hypothetical protein